jgi:2-polyprenyl-3-methyl-5-hydroxy-6-metoxy-1,4-benzoquinol methylase
MDDFYAAFGDGEFKASGVMNLTQHLYVTERCRPGDRVVDVCCGRGLALPLLCRYAPQIGSYIGLDISPTNLGEANAQAARASARWDTTFSVQLIETDVSQQWPTDASDAEVIIYTAALEHLPQAAGAASLAHAASALADDGLLYLSTPLTRGPVPKLLQYGVHVYEWDPDDLRTALTECGLIIVNEVGLLPPEPTVVLAGLRGRYGDAAADWYTRLRETLPAALLATVAAAALPELAGEAMFVCRRRP